MTILTGDIVEIIDEQTYDGQQVLNRYFYEVMTIDATIDPTPALIAEEWWTLVQTDLLATQNDGVVHTQIRAEVRTGDLEYGQYVIPSGDGTGVLACSGDYLSPFIAYGIGLTGASRITRPGSKRVVGACEDHIEDYGVLNSSIFGAVEAFADQITATLFGGGLGTTSLRPIIWRPPTGVALGVVNPITGYIVNPVLTTQNTRKRGRGS